MSGLGSISGFVRGLISNHEKAVHMKDISQLSKQMSSAINSSNRLVQIVRSGSGQCDKGVMGSASKLKDTYSSVRNKIDDYKAAIKESEYTHASKKMTQLNSMSAQLELHSSTLNKVSQMLDRCEQSDEQGVVYDRDSESALREQEADQKKYGRFGKEWYIKHEMKEQKKKDYSF